MEWQTAYACGPQETERKFSSLQLVVREPLSSQNPDDWIKTNEEVAHKVGKWLNSYCTPAMCRIIMEELE